MKSSAFKLLKSEITKAIYDLKWKNLRKIQEEAINAIINTKNDVIISAPTASGKTEAAFLPCLSNSIPEINNNIKIVYISPLKALINDQLLRVEELCQNLDCKVTKWHGDASQAKKNKLKKNPSGILLITPESLEAFLIVRNNFIPSLFGKVDYYIIDEVHNFVGGARGEQLLSILNRIDAIVDKRPTRILLSATIGSLENYKIWLGNQNPIFIKYNEIDKELEGKVKLFESDSDKYYKEMLDTTYFGKYLIFGNKKSDLEIHCNSLKSMAVSRSCDIEIHHGSLSKQHREDVETRLKNESNISVFCTTTLELGIDIGDIKKVLLISPPNSVASFIQRIGRSGRTENSKINFNFLLYNSEVNLDTSDHRICRGLRSELVQSIALIELMESRWCEPGNYQTQSYSTFVHQVMAFVAQKRVCKKIDIWNQVANKSFSEKVSESEFDEIIQSLINNSYLRIHGSNELILGLEGDKLTEYYDFYTVFFTPIEWLIYSETKKVGEIPIFNALEVGKYLILSGKAWEIVSVDYKSKSVKVVESKDGNPPLFPLLKPYVHRKIHEKMKSIFESSDLSYKYLDETTSGLLCNARDIYRLLIGIENFLPIFLGTGVTNVVSHLLNYYGISHHSYGTCIYLDKDKRQRAIDLIKKYDNAEKIKPTIDIVRAGETCLEKYDKLLPPSILRKSYINSVFDIEGFLDYLKICDNYRIENQ